MLIAAVLLGVGIIMLSVKLVNNREVAAVQETGKTGDSDDVIILLTEAEEKVTEEETAAESETQTEAITETVTETEKTAAQRETETETETEKEEGSTQPETAPRSDEEETESETVRSSTQADGTANEASADDAEDHPEPEDADPVVIIDNDSSSEMDSLVMASDDKYASTESNIRSGPGTEYDIIGGLNPGDSVHITGQTDNWYRIQTESGDTGYVSKSLLSDEYTPTYATIVSTCYLRSYDDYGDNIIMEVYGGQTVEVLSNPGGWAYISVDGVTGYVGSQFIG